MEQQRINSCLRPHIFDYVFIVSNMHAFHHPSLGQLNSKRASFLSSVAKTSQRALCLSKFLQSVSFVVCVESQCFVGEIQHQVRILLLQCDKKQQLWSQGK